MKSIVDLPPNAILFVLDPLNVDVIVPDYIAGRLVAATSSCVSVGTQAGVDGETTMSLSADGENADRTGLTMRFQGDIETPNRVLAIMRADRNVLLELAVSRQTTRVEIWTDDERNPARVSIVVDGSR
jgi:hypothetical protein